jgi:hypothetical protein
VGEGRDLETRADILVTETFDDGCLGEFAFASYEHAQKHLLKPGARIIPQGIRVFAACIESEEIFLNHRVHQVSGFDVNAFNEFTTRNYIGYHLDKVKWRPLTAVKQVFEFDLRTPPQGEKVAPVNFDVVRSGTCHAVAYWYELQMDEDTVISTAPGLPQLSSWKQAIRIFDAPPALREGEIHRMVANHDSETIWFT